ncbi:MAG: phytoene desaturase [Verrucomicrobia bacterium]|nr:phytoene desaturase [Verrucomicrobiota bacterium]
MANTRERKVAVIGGGIGGLTAASLLSKAGLSVTVFEKGERVGGKLNILESNGFSWDTGPSLITMPQILRDLWQRLDRPFGLDLVRLETSCRYFWTDGTVIDENAGFWKRPEVARFLRHAGGIFDISESTFLHRQPGAWWKKLSFGRLIHLPKIVDRRSLYQLAKHFFRDPHFLQLFCRFATYNGSSPFLTPAAFSVIPYTQAKFGSWYIRGGLYRIAEELEKICRENGVRFIMQAEVSSINRRRDRYVVGTRCHTITEFDLIVCNEDVITADSEIVPLCARRGYAGQNRMLSTSGFVMMLAVRETFKELSHHNVFFSDNYTAEFDQIFRQKVAPGEPTIYVAIDSKTEPGRAPVGFESWFVLVNVPAFRNRGGSRWGRIPEHYYPLIIRRLDKFGLKGLADNVLERHFLTPLDFSNRLNAFGGSLYGFASHGLFTAFRRPPMQNPKMPNMWFVGGTTHPGGGIPLVIISGEIAAASILNSQLISRK